MPKILVQRKELTFYTNEHVRHYARQYALMNEANTIRQGMVEKTKCGVRVRSRNTESVYGVGVWSQKLLFKTIL